MADELLKNAVLSSSGEQKTYLGRCNCGSIKYEIKGDPQFRVLCHCENCKRSSGAPFMANAMFAKEQVTITTPSTTLASYSDSATSSGAVIARQFCSTCGSPLFISHPGMPQMTICTTGSLTEADGETVADWGVPMAEYWAKKRNAWLPEIVNKQGVAMEMTLPGKE